SARTSRTRPRPNNKRGLTGVTNQPAFSTSHLDGDQWQVLGFSIGGGESEYHLQVVATPRDVWEKAASGDGEIEATEFLVHGIDPLAILQQMTHMFDMKMRRRGLDGRQVRIRAVSDIPSELFVEEIFGPQE
ncbi:hypothetical protein AB0M46_24430, partial [Dactylosporangium sp. NPDC051485]|uniref:hypothetical protein n=1 Tax=Dactylosporangium sp. NPDC051485 TaxID=3154846 RepID=UPI003430DC8F